ncbi:MAG: ATP-binding domain-containing protein, partial [Pseudooceanicola atlanticus]
RNAVKVKVLPAMFEDGAESIPYAIRRKADEFDYGYALTVHKAQGSQWKEVQVFAPDLFAAARVGRVEAGQPLWKRLAYVAITRAETRLHWIVRNRLAKPSVPLGVDDLRATPVAPLEMSLTSEDDTP